MCRHLCYNAHACLARLRCGPKASLLVLLVPSSYANKDATIEFEDSGLLNPLLTSAGMTNRKALPNSLINILALVDGTDKSDEPLAPFNYCHSVRIKPIWARSSRLGCVHFMLFGYC